MIAPPKSCSRSRRVAWIPVGSRFECLVNVGLVTVGGEKDDRAGEIVGTELPRRLDARGTGHSQIEQDDVGAQHTCLLERVRCVGGAAGDIDVASGIEHLAQPLDHDRMVIDKKYGDH